MLEQALLQAPGRRPCSVRMQAAIEEKKKVLAEKAETLRRTLGRSKGEKLDPLDDSSLSRSAKVYTNTASKHVIEHMAIP